MSHVGVPRGTVRKRRTLALFTAGVLTIPALAGCDSGGEKTATGVPQDIAPAVRGAIAQGSTLNWAVDAVPATLNTFQADADGSTTRITGALLPNLFPLDAAGQPKLNPDYLESAKVIDREPKQVVLYKLNQRAVWSDGREIGAPDFVAQWRALNGKDTAYWTARNAGYERIEKIERGHDDLQVRVTFSKPYGDWRSLFSPLYPKEVMGSPDSFNDGARTTLKNTAGPFRLGSVDKDTKTVTVVRDPRWWGGGAKLDKIVFRAVAPRDRGKALAAGTVDVADIDGTEAQRIRLAARDDSRNGRPLTHGPQADLSPAAALRSWALAHGSDEEAAEIAQASREKAKEAVEAYEAEQAGLRSYVVRKSLEPAYTQLALNGESGPLADERVRRAVARALDRQEIADSVLKPLGLPSEPLGSHLAMLGQPGYTDSSGAIGDQDTAEALALLADAGWTPGGARKPKGTEAGSEAEKSAAAKASASADADDPEEETDGAAGAEATETAEAAEATESAEATGSTDAAKTDSGSTDAAKTDSGGTGQSGTGSTATADGTGTTGTAKADGTGTDKTAADEKADAGNAGRYVVGDDGKPGDDDSAAQVSLQDRKAGGAPGLYAPVGTAAPRPAAPARHAPVRARIGKDGKTLSLRFVLPSGPESASLRKVGEKIAAMLDSVGISTVITKVSDASYFKDHIASGAYDLALYSWPASAYPATDGRPIFAKPVPASDGSLVVEQNYTRVGTDYIDQLFDRAVATLDQKTSRDLMKQADARIWAAAGSIPLYQRPQLVAVDKRLVNVGAFGFGTPRYQDIGFKDKKAAGAPARLTE
ncbi:ABC transporter family substrate-binding protein [Streptomyces sp. NBC_00102]|uniref:ABC transporter family substrate-binding protein n=1 Tax=Streptomyces sp. NBC_00102 TaxID=2975652 RepID=UPI00224E4C87|nr:ABC transporter family substrate-binding protein [Streptomyces sp. NBC_00102]MCX5399476.1 ABC transporter family substrate-binding protein [Streptomyces sp. NBC_00102]